MKKKTKIPYKTILVSLVIVALLGVTVSQAASGSLLDKIAQYAGQVLGNRAYDDLKGDLLPLVDEEIGAAAGTDHYFTETFYAGFGNKTLATTTAADSIIPASILDAYAYFEVKPIVGTHALTFPASSTAARILSGTGDTKTWMITNSTTTTNIAGRFTIAAGTGWNFQSTSTQVIGLDGAAYTARNSAKISCTRQVNSDFACLVLTFKGD